MSSPYLGEIRIFSFSLVPTNWAQCNGQLLSIQQNQGLFSLLSTTFGGDGRTTFALPNLQGRVPIHQGGGFTFGQAGGELTHTLSANELPTHTHGVVASANNASLAVPTGNLWAVQSDGSYAPTSDTFLNPASIASMGGNQAHNNISPYFALNFCIALTGLFP